MSELDTALDRLRATAKEGLGVEPVPAEPLVDRRAEELGGDDAVRLDDLAWERDPHTKLREIAAQLGPDGTAVIGSTQLAGFERSEYARFDRGEGGFWLVPGRLCLRRMVEAADLVIDAESELSDAPDGLVFGYLRAHNRREVQ
jgi:hypothetical protein